MLYSFRWGQNSVIATQYTAHRSFRNLLRRQEFARIHPYSAVEYPLDHLVPIVIDNDRVALVQSKLGASPSPGERRNRATLIILGPNLSSVICSPKHALLCTPSAIHLQSSSLSALPLLLLRPGVRWPDLVEQHCAY